MVEKWKAQEIVQYLEEQLSNSLFHDDFEANENGYRCAINDIKEKYIDEGCDYMNKQDLINDGYRHICTQNSESKMELWARFNGYKDTIVYLYYVPEKDMVLEQTRQTISYTHLDMMAQMRDKMRNDFLKFDVEYDKENIWQ